MKILHLSDTHGIHRKIKQLPDADILVHSGDFTKAGSEAEAIDFMDWLCELPYPHKIFICGNHDECMFDAHVDGLDANVHYLCHSGIIINDVKFYGVPTFLNDDFTRHQSRQYDNIPADTDVVITHVPPYGILDFNGYYYYGSEDLLMRVSELSPRLHLFGHIHSQHGITQLGCTTFSNGSIVSDDDTHLQVPNIIVL